MRDSVLLRRDDASCNTTTAVQQTRIAIEKVARSQTWDIEGAAPFPMDVLPLLQEATKLLARAQARIRAHAQEHVWPACQMHHQRERMTESFRATEDASHG
jgi:hypothetical protein